MRTPKKLCLILPALSLLTIGCEPKENAEAPQRLEYAIALHGGAGKPPAGLSPEKIAEFKREVTATLKKCLTTGKSMLERGETSMDVVEAVVRIMEDDPNFNAGRGSVLNIEGGFEMHASIMDGKSRDCGAVAAVDTIRNPISLARAVMEKTDFIILVGEGAERFGTEVEAETADRDYFLTELRYNNWLNARKELGLPPKETGEMGRLPPPNPEDLIGTVGCVALDKDGNLAAGTSTGGVSHKRFGRMGDSSIIGAGNYADNRSCAVSCTGIGEYFIRNSVAFHVNALMRYKGVSVEEAARLIIDEELADGSGGLIAVDHLGNIAMRFNRGGMRRAAADSTGKFVVEYWE